MSGIHEECGVYGIYGSSEDNIPGMIYYGLFALQHRGQESSGMAVSNGKSIKCYKEMGLVSEVYTSEVLDSLKDAKIGIGHNRYSTTGASTAVNAQPLVSHYSKGTLAICHNGNLINCDSLRTELENEGAIFQTTVDSEIISYLFAKERSMSDSIESAVKSVTSRIKGGYAILVMSHEKLIAIRDPYGIKPLVMGRKGSSTVFASESCALTASGAEFVRDVMPGEIVIVDDNGIKSEYFET